MIQFETLEEFDDAVMEVIRSRLTVGIDIVSGGSYYDTSKKIEISLADDEQYTNFSVSSVALPLPEIKY